MKVVENDKYISFEVDEPNIGSIHAELFSQLKNTDNKHVILNFTKSTLLSNEDFLLFLDVATQKKESGTSFVVVNKDISADDFPEHLNVVPTLKEAEDILEMEDIERELGF